VPPDLSPGIAPIHFGRAVCGDLAAAERREWWIANGRGGCAGGTIAQSLTRRYHALLVASVEPPLGRILIVHSLLIRDANGVP
jgi:hypothetical protein